MGVTQEAAGRVQGRMGVKVLCESDVKVHKTLTEEDFSQIHRCLLSNPKILHIKGTLRNYCSSYNSF